MSKPIKQKKSTPSTPKVIDIASQVAAIESGLGLTTSFTRTERLQARSRSEHVPDALIEQLATIAANNAGMIAGMPFDAAAARDALTHVSAARTNAKVVRQLAQRISDDATQRHTVVANRSFAVYRALARLVQTPEGESLRHVYEQMQSLMRTHGRKKAARTKNAAASPNAPAEAGGATAPAPTATSTPVVATPAVAH